MTKLEEIVAHKKLEVAQIKESAPLHQLERRLKDRSPVRNFQGALARAGQLTLIAEFKRASPSAGVIRQVADPLQVAQAYGQAGAQALSILTDRKFFSGSLQDLMKVREKTDLPVLRKDFLFEEYQVVESAAWGADCVLLIVAILKGSWLKKLLTLARDLNLSALVEVHTDKELGEALEAGASMIGINNRDLATLSIDLTVTQRLIQGIPKDKTVVSESGLRSREDVDFIRRLGAHAVLIGEELMSASDIGMRVKDLMSW